MFRVYEVYGSLLADLNEVRLRLSSDLGVEFHEHDSYYVGEYFLAMGPSGQRITIESNWLEDEDGRFCREEEFPDYGTLVYLKYRSTGQSNDGPALDEWSRKAGGVEFLDLLKRDFALAEK